MANTPLYVRIERALRARLATAQPGDVVPAETALAEEFGVARMTVRAALNALEADELIERIRGRGTFVRQRPAPRAAGTLMSFTTRFAAGGAARRPGWSRARSGRRPPRRRAALQLTAAAPTLVSIVRVRLADDVPLAVEYACFPPHLHPLLDADLETGSLHRALHEGGLRPTLGSSTLTAQPAGPDGPRLQVSDAEPLLVESRVIVGQHAAPLEYSVSRYVGSRYSLRVTFDVQPPRIGETP